MKGDIAYPIARGVAKILSKKAFGKIPTVSGLENIATNLPGLHIANHLDGFEGPSAIAAAIETKFTPVVSGWQSNVFKSTENIKKYYFDKRNNLGVINYFPSFPLGIGLVLLIKGVGAIYAYHDTGMWGTVNQVVEAVEQGEPVFIFPEIRRGYDIDEDGMRPFDLGLSTMIHKCFKKMEELPITCYAVSKKGNVLVSAIILLECISAPSRT